MSYILTTTNEVKFIFIDAETGQPQASYIFKARSYLKPKDLSKEYTLADNTIVTDNKGIRMFIEVILHNHPDLNTPSAIKSFLSNLDYIKGGLSRLKIYPMYESDMEESSLDVFDCILDKYYSIEKLHEFLDTGTNIKLEFKSYAPIFGWSPKHPTTNYPPFYQFDELLGDTV